MRYARIYPWRRTRRFRAPSNRPEAFFVAQFSAGYTTNMFGFDLRQGQPREVGARQVASSVVKNLSSAGSLSFSATELAGKRYLERGRRLGHRGGRREIPEAH